MAALLLLLAAQVPSTSCAPSADDGEQERQSGHRLSGSCSANTIVWDPAGEIDIMWQLRDAVLGSGLFQTASWASWQHSGSTHPCTWHGVKCNAQRQITILSVVSCRPVVADRLHVFRGAGPACPKATLASAAVISCIPGLSCLVELPTALCPTPCRTLLNTYTRTDPGAGAPNLPHDSFTDDGAAGEAAKGLLPDPSPPSPLLPELAQLQWLEELSMTMAVDHPTSGIPHEWWLPGAFPRLKQ